MKIFIYVCFDESHESEGERSMDNESSDHITDEIRQLIANKLSAYNQGRLLDAGSYIVVAPRENSLYYSLWRHDTVAVHHPYIYLTNLQLNALGSVESAIKIIANSFLPLEVRPTIELPPDHGDDILLFGKYRGYHLWEIYHIDPRYVQWIAEKFETQNRNEQRFKELAVTYNKVYLDLQTRKNYKQSASRFVCSVGAKLTNLHLKILHVRFEDDNYKTRTVDGTVYYYVDQLLNAVDEEGNRFFLIIKAADRSFNSQVVATVSHIYTPGDVIHLESAKVMKQYISRNIQYTKLGYLRFRKGE